MGDRDEDGDRRNELIQAQPRAPHRDHLGIGRQPAEGDQDGEQHRHRDGHLEEGRQDVAQEAQDVHDGNTARHDELDQLQETRDEQDEREDGEPERERDHDLPKDITVENPGHSSAV